MMEKKILGKNRGFSLVEFLVVLVISSILVAALYRTFIGQQKTYTVEDQVVDMQQNIRLSTSQMIRNIRMAGYGGDILKAFSNGITQATILAQDELEYLKQLSYGDSNLSNGQHNQGVVPGTIFSRSYRVVEDAGNSMKTITVTVQWKDRIDHSVSLKTIRAK